jgi:hypothetical protein
MKQNKNIITFVLWLSLFLLFISLFIFGNKMNPDLKRLVSLTASAYLTVVLIFSYFKLNRLGKAVVQNKKIAEEVIDGSIKLLEHIYETKIQLNGKKTEFKKSGINENARELLLKINEILAIRKENGQRDVLFHRPDPDDKSSIFIKQKYNAVIIGELIRSIIKNTENFSGPLSDSIFQIKSKIKTFLEDIHRWKNEFNDEKSEKNFNNIIGKFDMQNRNFENIFSLINKNYLHMEKNFDNIMNMVEKIVKNTGKIDDISEKIRILSINASIEAARAGEYGKGFKIVSNEVKKLSNDTQISTKEIIPITNDTKKTVNSSITEYNNELMTIINMIKTEKDEFRAFYEILKNYYNDLDNLFTSVSDVICDINENIDGLTPVFQFANLSVQEMGNIIKIIDKFNNNQEDIASLSSSLDDDSKKKIISELITDIKTEISTESEISTINGLYEQYGLITDKIAQKKMEGIELF